MLPLHRLRRARRRQITLHGKRNLARKNFADLIIAFAREESAQRLVFAAVVLEISQEALYGVGNGGSRAAIADRPRDGRNLPEAAAHAEVVSVDQFAVLFDLLAFDADIGDPVLAAAVGAAGDVQLDLLREAGQAFVQFAGKPAREAFRFGEGKLAEFRARAGDRAAGES